MVESIMKPLMNGLFSNTPELHWICEFCGKEFTGFRAYILAEQHEMECSKK